MQTNCLYRVQILSYNDRFGSNVFLCMSNGVGFSPGRAVAVACPGLSEISSLLRALPPKTRWDYLKESIPMMVTKRTELKDCDVFFGCFFFF